MKTTKYAFVFFIILTFLISWFPWFIGGKGLLVFGPSIAGVIIIAKTRGKEGLQDILKRALKWKVGFLWWIITLLLPGALILIAIGINFLINGKAPPMSFFSKQSYLIPVFFLMSMLGGPLGEEFGWRGFALPYLQKLKGPLFASITLGTIWGLWHVPQFFTPGTLHILLGPKLLPVFIIGEISLSIIMTWVYNKTKGSLLVGGFMYHNADNVWSVLMLTGVTMAEVFDNTKETVVDKNICLVSGIVGVIFSVIILGVTKRKLGYSSEDS